MSWNSGFTAGPPLTEKDAAEVAETLGLKLGTSRHKFAGRYRIKGLYAYKTGRHEGVAFFGQGGSDEDKTKALDDPKYRPELITVTDPDDDYPADPDDDYPAGPDDDYPAGPDDMSSGPPSKQATTASSSPVMATALDTIGRCFVIDFDKHSFIGIGPKIFDIDENQVDLVKRPQANTETETVSSDEATSKTFSTKVGVSASFMGFGGSASFGLDKSEARSKHTTRITVENVCNKYKVSGSTNFILQPENFLDADLAERIRKGDISMEDLEKVIGVFYAREYHLGGVFTRSYFMEKKEKETSLDVRSKVEATFNGVLAKASLSVEIGMSKAKLNKKAQCRIVEDIVGGDTEIWLGAGSHREGDRLLTEWSASVNDTNLHPTSYALEFSWKLVEALNQSLGEDYKDFLQAKWNKQKLTAKLDELEFVQEDKPPPFFHLKNGNGHYLAVSGNNFNQSGVCVWSKTSSAGQLWIWEGKKLRTKLGAKYLSISRNSGSRGAEVILWSNKGEDRAGQQWALKKDGHLQNGKGLFLAVNGNGGRGSELCQWSSKNGGGQIWEQVDHVE